MSRLFFLIAVVAVVYWLFRLLRKQAPKPDVVDAAGEDMVLCAHCGVHVPKSSAVLVAGKSFCSEVHRQAYQSK